MSTTSGLDLREVLLQQILDFVSQRTDAEGDRAAERVSALLAAASDSELAELVRSVGSEDYAFAYHPPVEVARRLHHYLAELVLTPDSGLTGAEHVRPVAGDKLVLLSNHVSFADANLIEICLHRAGFDALCRRLTVIAGPKVYSNPLRRFSSLCFGTIKTAQSAERATGEAVMRPRDVAKIAQQTIGCAFERLEAGDALVLFPEGTRSRDGRLQQLLPAVARYCERPDVWLVPLGIAGSESLLGIDETRLHSTRIMVQAGPPVRAAELVERCGRNRAQIVAALGGMIARCLPEPYRGAYA